MKAQAKSKGPVHESLVQVTYASSEGPSERAHSCIIGYLKQKGDKSSRRQLRGLYVKGCTLCMLSNCTSFFISLSVVLPKTNSFQKVFEGYH